MNANGTDVRQLGSEESAFAPEWSPDGQRLVLIQGSGLEFRGRQPEEEQLFQIRWMPASGGDTQFVTTVKIAVVAPIPRAAVSTKRILPCCSR